MHRAQISNTQHEKKYRRAVRDHRGEPQQHVGIDGIEAAEPGDAVDGRRAVAVFPFDLLVQHLGAEGVKGAELLALDDGADSAFFAADGNADGFAAAQQRLHGVAEHRPVGVHLIGVVRLGQALINIGFQRCGVLGELIGSPFQHGEHALVDRRNGFPVGDIHLDRIVREIAVLLLVVRSETGQIIENQSLFEQRRVPVDGHDVRLFVGLQTEHLQHLSLEFTCAELALGEHLFLLVVFHIGAEGGQHEHSDMTGIVPGDRQVISGESAFTDRIVVGRFLGKIIDVAERERRG